VTWIAALSSSSPQSSVGLFHLPSGERWCELRSAPIQASGALLAMLQRLLEERGLSLRDLHGFVTDGGPGSFVGTRVSVMLAKVLAYQLSVPVARVSAFDLMPKRLARVIPHRRNEWFVERDGEIELSATLDPDFIGYGFNEARTYPDVSRLQLDGLPWGDPFQLVPGYLADPSISTPKVPYRTVNP
jgi:tRNA threonylcarbamoyl adenosine modification protein YeaZ